MVAIRGKAEELCGCAIRVIVVYSFAMKNVAVTGASGLIGERLLGRLTADPEVERVIVLDIRRPAVDSPKITFLEKDVSVPFDGLFEEFQVDAAFHLAFILNPIHDRARMRAVNLGGTRNFLAACDRAGVKDVLVVSSGTAYGAHPDNPPLLTEDCPIRANEDFSYVADKGEMERIARAWGDAHPEVNLSVVRPCIVLGPRVNNFISRSLLRKRFFKVRGANPPMQFVHEEDVAEVFYRIVRQGKRGAFNVAGDGTLNVFEVARKVDGKVLDLPYWLLAALGRLGWWLHITVLTEADPGVLAFVRYPWLLDNSRTKQELGFTYRYTTEQALDAAIEARRPLPAGGKT